MITVSTTNILRHPVLLNASNEITLIEDELYLMCNQKALGVQAYKEFLEVEEIVEDLE